MAEIFNNKPGSVQVLATSGANNNPFRVTIDGFPETGSQGGAILTELAIQRHGNFQFMHTLKDLVYVYSFGERIGQIRASGMAFARLCNGTEGLKAVLAYYEANRLEVRSSPISIVIGTSGAGRFRGFLTELNVDVSRPEARLAQFGLQFHVLPSAKTSTGSSGGGGSGGSSGAGNAAAVGGAAAAGINAGAASVGAAGGLASAGVSGAGSNGPPASGGMPDLPANVFASPSSLPANVFGPATPHAAASRYSREG
jgi:hypothetical protein